MGQNGVDVKRPDFVRPEPAEGFPFRRGDAIDRFTVLEVLGMGGMGVVVSAFDCSLDRRVAIKVQRSDRFADNPEEGRARLMREAKAMARLNHPNVMTVYEVGIVDDRVFIAMELVDGKTLAGWLGGRGHTWREVLRTFVQAGRGLAAAHRVGLVHRDFKPDNVLVSARGEVRISDFGLVGASAGSPAVHEPPSPAMVASLTRTGVAMGTPLYMSPEQHRGEEVDARSDQFNFCVSLYEALYRVMPFAGETSVALLDAILARRLSTPRREVPRWLRSPILRGLEPRPEDRWPSIDDLLAALGRDPAAARRRWLLLATAPSTRATVPAPRARVRPSSARPSRIRQRRTLTPPARIPPGKIRPAVRHDREGGTWPSSTVEHSSTIRRRASRPG